MTKNYLNEILQEFDQAFATLTTESTDNEVYHNVVNAVERSVNDLQDASKAERELKLQKIEAMAAEISSERYSSNYNPEICLANMLNLVLSKNIAQADENNFFQLLNKERKIDLGEALNDFDFYLNNPYKKKAEKILSRIEARKNK